MSSVFIALCTDTKFIIKSQRAHHTYFYPDRVAEYMEMNFVAGETQAESLYLHAKSLLTTYIMFGVDQNPGFNQISHSLGLDAWEEMSRRKVLSTEDDYLELVLQSYERREPGLKKIFFSSAEAMSAGISGWHTQFL